MPYIAMKLDGIFDMSYDDVLELHEEQNYHDYKKNISEIQGLCENNGRVYLVASHDDGRRCDPILGVFSDIESAKKCCDEYKEMCPEDYIYISEPWEVYYSKKHYYDCQMAGTYIQEFDLKFEDYNFKGIECCDICSMYSFSPDEEDESEYVNIVQRDCKKRIYTLEMVFLPRRKKFVFRGRNEDDMSTYTEMKITHCPFCGRDLTKRIQKALKNKLI